MRRISKFLAAALVTIPIFWVSTSRAAFFGLPRVLESQIKMIGSATRISLGTPVLEPIGHTRFCLKYPDECTVHGIDFRRRNIALTEERWSELNTVNREVNRNIIPEVTPGNDVTDAWVIAPPAGDCKDYAITKRHELLARGWPSRSCYSLKSWCQTESIILSSLCERRTSIWCSITSMPISGQWQ